MGQVFNEKIELSEYLCRCCKAAEDGKMPMNPKLNPERATELKVRHACANPRLPARALSKCTRLNDCPILRLLCPL